MTAEDTPIDHLSAEDLRAIAAGVVDGAQVRDIGLLPSAAARPQTTVFGADACPTLADKVAALTHSLGRNHALVDGNKRLAWSGGRVCCLLNGFDLVLDIDEAERLVLGIATGDLDVPHISAVVARGLR